MALVVELALLIFITVVSRLMFLTVNVTSAPNSDALFHLWYSKKFFKEEGRSFNKKKFKGSIIDGNIHYPPLIHFLLSFLPDKYILLAGYLLNILFDSMNAVFIYFAGFLIFDAVETPITASSFSLSFYLSLVWASCPLLHPVNARLTGIGARTLGPFLTNLYFFGLYFVINGSYLSVAICLLSLLLIILSSQFALQVVLVFSLVLSIIYKSYLVFLLPVVFVIIVVSLNVAGIRKQMLAKWQHLKWYFDKRSNPDTLSRGSIDKIVKYFRSLNGNFAGSVYGVLTDVPVVVTFVLYPMLWMFVFVVFCGGEPLISQLYDNAIFFYCLSVVASSFVVFFVTIKKPFSAIGEAERYVEYAVPFLSVLFVVACSYTNFSLLPILVVVNMSFVMLNIFLFNHYVFERNVKCFNDVQTAELVDCIVKHSSGNIISIPIKLSFKFGLYLDQNKFKLYYPMFFEEVGGYNFSFDDCEKYDMINRDVISVVNKYDVDLLVLDKDYYMNAYVAQVGQADFSGLVSIFENDKYQVFSSHKS